MPKYIMPDYFCMKDLPEYKRLMSLNPGTEIKAKQVAVMYSKAIDWFAILETIWPDFKNVTYMSIEVAYLFIHDPDDEKFPKELYQQIAEMIAKFWEIQLNDLYIDGEWKIEIRDDPEVTIELEINKNKQKGSGH